MLKVGLIGNGGIAAPHKAAYEKQESERDFADIEAAMEELEF